MTLLIGMMMIALIFMVSVPQIESSTAYTGKFSQDKAVHQDQRLQSVDLPLISNQLSLGHAPLMLLSSKVNADSIEALSSTIPDYEMQALKDFYDSTDGVWWGKSFNDGQWDFTDDNVNPCAIDKAWKGLSCVYDSSNGIFHVTSIDLQGYNLRGTLPSSLGQLSKLTYLFLSSNSLTGTLPDSLGQLSKLDSLALYSSSFNGTIPSSLGQLSKLTYLTLDTNSLTGTLPDSLGQRSELIYLSVYSNQLTGTIPSSLCTCYNKYLMLFDNKFDCVPKCIVSGGQKRYNLNVDGYTPVCDGPSYNDICESKKSFIIVWIVLPIAFVLLVVALMYLYYKCRNRCNSLTVDASDRRSQYVDINQNNSIIDEDNYRNHDVNFDLRTSEVPEKSIRIKDISTLVGGNGASNEDRHQRRDNVSQVLEPVVRGELVSTVAGAVATDNETLNLPTAVAANIDDEDVLYVDLFVDV